MTLPSQYLSQIYIFWIQFFKSLHRGRPNNRFPHFLAGEDGQIKMWSKSGMLRSTLATQGEAKTQNSKLWANIFWLKLLW